LTRSRLCFLDIHVVESELLAGLNVLQSEECQIVDPSVEAVVAYGEQTAVRIATVIDEPSRATHYFAVSDVAVAFMQRSWLLVIFCVLVQRKQVRGFVVGAGCFTNACLTVRDQLSEVAINILSTFEVNRTTQTFVACQ
jgi:hypothetical protein